jgi:hypothetical protein
VARSARLGPLAALGTSKAAQCEAEPLPPLAARDHYRDGIITEISEVMMPQCAVFKPLATVGAGDRRWSRASELPLAWPPVCSARLSEP